LDDLFLTGISYHGDAVKNEANNLDVLSIMLLQCLDTIGWVKEWATSL